MGTRTIEDFVDDIISNVLEEDFDSLSSVYETLERMKYSSKDKYRLNYWKVMQCFGEMASDSLVKLLMKIEKNSCKCHFHTNFKCVMNIFAESMCNVKVVKRANVNLSVLAPVLFKAVRQTEDAHLALLGREAIHRLIIVGRAEAINFFFKYGLMKDLYQQIKASHGARVYTYSVIQTLLHATKMLVTVTICGSEKVRKQVKRSGATKLLAEVIVKMVAKKDDKYGVTELCDSYKQLNTMLHDETMVECERKTWKPKERLQEEQEQDQLYLFCSSPACRKIHGDSKGFRYCGACRLARYCCEACQKEHWKKGHREACQGEPEVLRTK